MKKTLRLAPIGTGKSRKTFACRGHLGYGRDRPVRPHDTMFPPDVSAPFGQDLPRHLAQPRYLHVIHRRFGCFFCRPRRGGRELLEKSKSKFREFAEDSAFQAASPQPALRCQRLHGLAQLFRPL